MSERDRETEHELKCHPEEYDAIEAGLKTFEFRWDDRGYAVGDTLWLRRWDPNTGEYTGQEMRRRVTSVLRNRFGVPIGYVVMSLAARPASPVNGDLPLTREEVERAVQVAGDYGRVGDEGFEVAEHLFGGEWKNAHLRAIWYFLAWQKVRPSTPGYTDGWRAAQEAAVRACDAPGPNGRLPVYAADCRSAIRAMPVPVPPGGVRGEPRQLTCEDVGCPKCCPPEGEPR